MPTARSFCTRLTEQGRRLVFVNLSKQHFGFGIEDWEGGLKVEEAIHAIQENFTIVGWNLPLYGRQKRAKEFLFVYLQEALDQVGSC